MTYTTYFLPFTIHTMATQQHQMSESIEHSLSVVIKQPPNPITINFHHPGDYQPIKESVRQC